MILLGSEKLKSLLKTDNLYSFTEEVLINNLYTLYPDSTLITIHTDYSNNNDLVALIIK